MSVNPEKKYTYTIYQKKAELLFHHLKLARLYDAACLVP